MTPFQNNHQTNTISRRAFIKMSSATSMLLATKVQGATDSGDRLRIGLITDIHYADLDTAGSRHYRDSVTKVREAVQVFNEAKPDMVICLGDLIDAGPSVEKEAAHLDTMVQEFKQMRAPRRFVLGNHCVWTLTKSEFLKGVGQDRSYDTWNQKGVRLIALDACFTKEGADYGRKNYTWTDTDIPKKERDWLRTVLASDPRPTLVFVHQRLDVEGSYGVHSAAEVRRILEESKQVVAVFQGHNHVNDHRIIQGIHYLTMNAVIEGPAPANNSFAVLEYAPKSQTIRIDGYHHQKDYNLST